MHSRQIMTAFRKITVNSPWTAPAARNRMPVRTPAVHPGMRPGIFILFFQVNIDELLPGVFLFGTENRIQDPAFRVHDKSGGYGGYIGQHGRI